MKHKTKTNFWFRLTAFIIDFSIVYGLAFILFNLLQLFYVFIPTVKLTLIIAIIYFPVITIIFKTTIGKSLCGLTVESESKLNSSMTVLLRELVFKQLFYIVPLLSLVIYFKLYWLSPLFEMFYVFILSLILFTIFLFQKRTWYDKWAKTFTVKKVDYDITYAKKGIVILMSLMFIVIAIRSSYKILDNSFNSAFIPKYSENAIKPYVSFLEKQKDANDYIFNLFEKNDIVILCERAHPEMTQYDFIFDLVSDKRFIENIGNVFSEVGSRTQQSNLDSLMNTNNLSNEDLDLKLCKILQNYSGFPVWANTNYFNYFKKLYLLNQGLPKEKRIHHFFTDIECNWEVIHNKEDYQKTFVANRDEMLAKKVINGYEQILISNQGRKKCLVIMNYRHAFNSTNANTEDGGDSWVTCASYIMQKFPDKSANVLINQVKTGFGLSKSELQGVQQSPINNGIWDNAFKAIGNKSLGFDFKDSPFGKDKFDLFLVPTWEKYKYQDIFTGYLFYKPFEEHYSSYGFKNIVANGFDKEILNRATIIDDHSNDPDIDIKCVKKTIERLRRQELTINNKPYREYESVFELFFGTILLILGFGLGLTVFFIKKKNHEA